MTDYEEISIIVGQVRGLIARADKITENGRNLSDQKIEIGITGGTYTDFCEIVKKVRKSMTETDFDNIQCCSHWLTSESVTGQS